MIKKLYWNFVNYGNQKIFFTVTNQGLNFISSPKSQIAEIYDLYQKDKFEFEYQKSKTEKYHEEILEYLNTERTKFDLPLDLSSIGTSLQRQVWHAITKIPYGEIRTYHQLMETLKMQEKAKLIQAINANPLLMMIPDHRVIESNDALGAYRGGLAMKSQLIEMEAINGINNI